MFRVYLTVENTATGYWGQFRGDATTMTGACRQAMELAQKAEEGLTSEQRAALAEFFSHARAQIAGRKNMPCATATGIRDGLIYVAEVFRR